MAAAAAVSDSSTGELLARTSSGSLLLASTTADALCDCLVMSAQCFIGKVDSCWICSMMGF
jgi:hypothetical protein